MRRVVTALLAVLTAAAVVVIGGRIAWNSLQQHTIPAVCTAGGYSMSPDQAAVASTMVGVVLQRGLPERAAVLVLAAALQESKLDNLAPGEGDRDSVGVLQQRPSQGWGNEAQLNDLHYATGAFLDALIKIDKWETGDLAHTIQQVQVSADETAYARHEGQAQAIADAFMGTTPAGLSCTYPTPSTVAATTDVAAQLAADLPVHPPTSTPTTVTAAGASWPTAAWFVANGERLGLESVRYAGRTWVRTKGWRNDTAANGAAVVATSHALKQG